MGDPFEAEDPELNERLARSGLVWPRTDQELDAWLAAQQLSPEEQVWIRGVVQRRIEEARRGVRRDPLPAAPPAIGSPVLEPGPEVAAKATPERSAARPRRLSAEDLSLLDRQLLELVESGVPLPTGLQAYAADLSSGRLSGVIDELRTDLLGGLPLSEAIGRRGQAFPPIYRALVAAGEASGDLAGCLHLLHEQAESDAEIGRRLKESLAYPVAALVVAVAGLLFLGLVEVPRFARLYADLGVELPLPSQLLLDVTGFLASPPGLVSALVGFPLLLGAARVAARRWIPGLVGGLLDGKLRTRSLAELTRALAGFLGRGVPLPTAFGALATAFEGRFPPGSLAQVQARLEGGATLAAALRPEPVFPRTYVWLAGAAEARGTLPEALHDLALRYEQRLKARLGLIEALAGPAALALVSLIAGAAALAVLLPLFEIQKALQQ